MKKLAVSALALAMSLTVVSVANAQTDNRGPNPAQVTTQVTSIGGFAVSTAIATGIAATVAAAIIANAKSNDILPPDEGGGGTDPEEPEFTLICNEGDAPPVDGVCTNNSVTVTVTGTGTATSTITVPVVRTYPAIITRI